MLRVDFYEIKDDLLMKRKIGQIAMQIE